MLSSCIPCAFQSLHQGALLLQVISHTVHMIYHSNQFLSSSFQLVLSSGSNTCSSSMYTSRRLLWHTALPLFCTRLLAVIFFYNEGLTCCDCCLKMASFSAAA